jgi:lipopolysaccharide biosynthesis glycosyltransferase
MIQKRAVCTIIAKNYLAFARTLARSFLNLHPDYQCYVLIVDDFEGYVSPQDECFEIVRLTDLDLPNLPGFCFKYDVKELCTAAKASLLDYLINEKGVTKLLYLDPDILVTGSLNKLYEKLDVDDIILTPHLDRDYPDDDLLPNDAHILKAGQFNLGFIGINSSENAQRFLKWWKPKLHQKCVIDFLNGYFVDQKFTDFVPLFFEQVLIEKDVGYNVAYWNLHSRRVRSEKGQWKCNDGPLYFFHFSGYQPERNVISNHIPECLARYTLSNRRDLRKLFAQYEEMLIANDYRQAISWPYTFGYFKSGEPIHSGLRIHYRNLRAEWRRFGNPFESEELKLRNNVEVRFLTSPEQLNAILNSRAWRWVCRYGRFKNRFLMPARHFLANLSGPRRRLVRQSAKR